MTLSDFVLFSTFLCYFSFIFDLLIEVFIFLLVEVSFSLYDDVHGPWKISSIIFLVKFYSNPHIILQTLDDLNGRLLIPASANIFLYHFLSVLCRFCS